MRNEARPSGTAGLVNPSFKRFTLSTRPCRTSSHSHALTESFYTRRMPAASKKGKVIPITGLCGLEGG